MAATSVGKLTNLKSGLSALRPLVKRQTDPDGHSKVSEPWRNWYWTAEWKALKADVHLRDMYICQMGDCGKLITNPRQRIADHRIPHRGDRRLFFDRDNVQTLCKPCHDSRKQAEERRRPRG